MGYYQLYKGLEQAVKSNRGAVPYSIKSLLLDGANESVITNSNIGISGDAEFTLEAWFKASSLSDFRAIVFMGNHSLTLAAASLVIMSNGAVGISFAGGHNAHTAAGVITTGNWYYVVITKTPGAINTTAKVFVNAVEKSLATPSVNTPNITNAQVRIGRFGTTLDYFNGNIDEVGIRNVAKTESVIIDSYNAGKPKLMETVGLIANYRMGEKATWDGSNWTFPDQQGSNNAVSVNMEFADVVLDVP